MLAAEAAAVEAADAAAVPTVPGQEPAPVVDPAQQWAAVPALFGDLLAMALPEVKPFYSPEICRTWGEKMVPVADELGWNASEVLGPKMALAVASVPLVMGPIVVLKARKEAAKSRELSEVGESKNTVAGQVEPPREGIQIKLGGG